MKIQEMTLFKKPIAHRGLWDERLPENSTGAFKKAAEKGYPIEFDVQITKDNKLIVFHDKNLLRMTGCDSYVIDKTSAEIKELRLGYTDYKVPLFSETLEEINGKTPLLIEIKNTLKNIELCDGIVKQLLNYKGEFALQSFNPYILKYFFDKYPLLIRGQLSTYDYDGNVSRFQSFVLKRMLLNHSTKPHFISYESKYLPNKYVGKYLEKKIPLLAWTVKEQKEYDRIKNYATNIIFEGFIPKE
jgi:glycerophosphoryl diester phosphodiesterase